MATALCRTCVFASASCTSSTSVSAVTSGGAAPCLRTNLAAAGAAEPHLGLLTLSNRGSFVRGAKLRKVRAEDIKAEQQLYVREEDDIEAEQFMQIIVPVVDSQLPEEKLDESDGFSELEEVRVFHIKLFNMYGKFYIFNSYSH
jgi:hypothetical protein